MDKLTGKVAEMTRKEWRDLGFFYVSSESNKAWSLHGSQNGLLNLAGEIRTFCGKNEIFGEHEHLLPHWYLTLTFDEHLDINGRGIQGRKSDFLALASNIEKVLFDCKIGDTIDVSEFIDNSSYKMVLSICEAKFDPSTLDPQLES